MTSTIIIVICVLILIAYVFDISFSKTRVPSVLLLLITGWLIQQGTQVLALPVPDLSAILPILGTLGLILIVLEGGIELELDKSKLRTIRQATYLAVLPMLAMALILVVTMMYRGYSLHTSIINVLPLCVISSSLAIPSARHLGAANKEFVTYESSISDIAGVVLFNLFATSDAINGAMIPALIIQVVAMCLVSFVATGLLSILLSKLEHPVKFTPIIALVILIYILAKLLNLPSLIFILIFGLFIGNLILFRKWTTYFRPEVLERESHKFGDVLKEATFLIKSFFFVLFGYLLNFDEVANPDTLLMAIGILALIYTIRAIHLAIFKIPILPLLLFAPRGLITILLFLMVPVQIPGFDRSLVTQLIVLSSLVMTIGTVYGGRRSQTDTPQT